MKKRVFIALVFCAIMMSFAVAVLANVTESGIAVLLSVGDENRPIEGLMYFYDCTGNPLTPCASLLLAPKDEPIFAQIWPKGALNPKDFNIAYTTEAIMPRKPKVATFDPNYGWKIKLSAGEIANYPGDDCNPPLARALQIATTDRDGHKTIIRFLLKATFGSPLTKYDQLVIKTVPRSELASFGGGGGGSNAQAAIDALDANVKQLAGVVTAQTREIRNIQGWIGKTLSDGTAPVGTSTKPVTFPVKLTGSFTTANMWVVKDGQLLSANTVITSKEQMVTAPPGACTVYVEASSNPGKLIFDGFAVNQIANHATKKASFEVTPSSTSGYEIILGGAQ